jgi:hypothetical protein
MIGWILYSTDQAFEHIGRFFNVLLSFYPGSRFFISNLPGYFQRGTCVVDRVTLIVGRI